MRFAFGPFEIAPARRELLFEGHPLELHSKAAFDTLAFLVQRKGRLVLKDELIETVWPDTTVLNVNLNVAISTLRRHLDPPMKGLLGTEKSCIKTEHRMGFRILLPVTEIAEESGSQEEEPYEFRALNNDLVLEMMDSTGANVRFTKQSRIRVIHENAYYYLEDMSADGEQTDFEVSPGFVESVEKEEGKNLIKTTFGRPRRKGEEFDRTFTCMFRGSFCKEQEYGVQRQVYPTEQFTITILFPIERPYRNFRAVLKQGTYLRPCPQPEESIVEGKRSLIWKVQSPLFKESYKIEWAW